MDVTVYYTDGYDPAPGGVERVTTPLESGWDRWRVCFRSDEEEPDVWSLSMERWFKHAEEGWGWYIQNRVLMKRCGGMAEYADWLARSVSIVEVDGRPFWANPSLEGAE